MSIAYEIVKLERVRKPDGRTWRNFTLRATEKDDRGDVIGTAEVFGSSFRVYDDDRLCVIQYARSHRWLDVLNEDLRRQREFPIRTVENITLPDPTVDPSEIKP